MKEFSVKISCRKSYREIIENRNLRVDAVIGYMHTGQSLFAEADKQQASMHEPYLLAVVQIEVKGMWNVEF